MKSAALLALTCALLAFAPELPAQAAPASTPLTPHVGSPVAFRIRLPKGWTIEREDEMLSAYADDAAVVVTASDVMAEEDSGLPVGEAEARRIMTNMILGSDSLLFAMLNEAVRGFEEGGSELENVVRKTGTFAGERSGYLSGTSRDLLDVPARVEAHFTMKDGIVYFIMFMAAEDRYAAYEPLFNGVRDSFVFSAAPSAPALQRGGGKAPTRGGGKGEPPIEPRPEEPAGPPGGRRT